MTSDQALERGMALARRIFARRGNHAEIHLTEVQLAALLALAAASHPSVALRSLALALKSETGE